MPASPPTRSSYSAKASGLPCIYAARVAAGIRPSPSGNRVLRLIPRKSAGSPSQLGGPHRQQMIRKANCGYFTISNRRRSVSSYERSLTIMSKRAETSDPSGIVCEREDANRTNTFTDGAHCDALPAFCELRILCPSSPRRRHTSSRFGAHSRRLPGSRPRPGAGQKDRPCVHWRYM